MAENAVVAVLATRRAPPTLALDPRLARVQMSGPLIILTGLIYAYVAAEQFWRGNPAMGVTYAGYAFSNIGLFLLAR